MHRTVDEKLRAAEARVEGTGPLRTVETEKDAEAAVAGAKGGGGLLETVKRAVTRSEE